MEDNGDRLTADRLAELQRRLSQPGNLDAIGETTGLLNVHHRLRIFFGGSGVLRLGRSRMGGLRVEMVLPIANSEIEERG